jgi:chemotaxis protein CheX
MNRFTTTQQDEIFMVKIPQPFDASAAEAFSKAANQWLLNPATLFLIDFTGHLEIKSQCYRPIIALSKILDKNHRHLSCLGLNDRIIKNLMIDGVCGAFSPSESIEAASKKFLGKGNESMTTSKSPIDGRFINPFIAATLKTLSLQARTQGEIGKPYVLKEENNLAIDIAGVIGLASNLYKGSITIGFTAPVFLKIYENMFGEKLDTITPDAQDAASEILNIVYGMAKREINENVGCDFQPSLPTVLVGEKLKVRHSSSTPVIILPFQTTAGPFHIEVVIEKI